MNFLHTSYVRIETKQFNIMKKTIKLFAVAGLVALTIVSCKKKDSDDSTTADTTNTTATNGTNNSDPTPSQDFPADEVSFKTAIANNDTKNWGEATFELAGVGVQDCRHDDIMTLKGDGTYSYDNGALTCGTDEATKTGTWEANFTAKTITFDKGESDEYSADIVSLSNTKFVLKGKWNGMDISGTYASL